MNPQRISVAILGSGRVADLLAQRIQARRDLSLAAVQATNDTPPADTACVVYLPTSTELVNGSASTRVIALLQAGFNVVSTAPPAALFNADPTNSAPTNAELTNADLLGACRAGSSTFHGSGGFQSSLATRFNRAFAAITRNIRDVELIEELDIADLPVHPWASVADSGLSGGAGDAAGGAAADPQAVTARALAVEGYYDAGLRTLSEAVFGNPRPEDEISCTAALARRDDTPKRGRSVAQASNEQLVVRRSLGAQVAYDSIWTHRQGGTTPLRYQLNTATDDASGHVTLSFHAEGDTHPADHLTCIGLLSAIRPVVESAPGVLHHDLEINHVKSDERLAH